MTWARSVGSESPRGHGVPARGWPTCADAVVVRAPPAASSTFGCPLLSGQLPKVLTVYRTVFSRNLTLVSGSQCPHVSYLVASRVTPKGDTQRARPSGVVVPLESSLGH